MPRLLTISKYWVLCVVGALAFALSKVYAMLTPSIGLCLMPLTVCGALIPVASRIVGTMSMMRRKGRHRSAEGRRQRGSDSASPQNRSIPAARGRDLRRRDRYPHGGQRSGLPGAVPVQRQDRQRDVQSWTDASDSCGRDEGAGSDCPSARLGRTAKRSCKGGAAGSAPPKATESPAPDTFKKTRSST